ncbi:ATP-binding protein [Ekhidna sp.]
MDVYLSTMLTNLCRTLLLLLCYSTFGQIETLHKTSQHYTTEDGLPQSFVSNIAQDKDGFIWVATLDGLARYDGKEFIYFKIDSDTNRRISTSQIYDIYLDSRNQLWIFHFNHIVDKVDASTLEITLDVQPVVSVAHTSFQQGFGSKTVNQIVNDEHGNWFAGDTTNVELYDSSNLRLVHFFKSSAHSRLPIVYGFTEDTKGRLWIMTDEGLAVSDLNWVNFQKINIPESFSYNPEPQTLKEMMVLSNSRVLFAYKNRLFLYEENKMKFSELSLPLLPELEGDYISAITKDHQGRAILKYNGYILRVEHDNTITYLWESPTRESFIITSVLIDRSNTMWVGINTGGLYRVDLNSPTFQSYSYQRNFLVDILTNHLGISESTIPPNWKQKGWSYGMRYCYSKYGLLITHESYGYGNARKIYRLNNGKLEQLPLEDKYFHYIIGIDESDSALWALDIEGFFFKWKSIYEMPAEKKVKHIPHTGVERFSDMVVDDQFQWVIATKNLIYQLDDGKIIDQFEVGKIGTSLIDLCEDMSDPDIMWIGTLGGGLLKWSKSQKETISVFEVEHGLSNNSIGSIVPDTLGNLWLGTFNGISRFDTKTNEFVNYTTRDGIIESEFNRHHGFILPDGRIALGATMGYSIFDPKKFKKDEFNPSVIVSDLQINGKKIQSRFLSQQSLNELTQLNLNHEQNSLRFSVAAMQYNDPEANQYRYKLENFNDDWILNGNQRVIRFDNLSPGKYTLLLNASNTDGVWSDKVNKISITINPPLWLSWWAYTLYFLIAIFLIFNYWRNYKKRLNRLQEIEFNKREATRLQEIDNIKTRFFSNITHEFRTPLTLILSPLEKQIRDKKYSEEVQQILENNYKHGSHLLNLVNQLLDISKLESGHMQVHKSVGDLVEFVKIYVDQFRDYAKEKEISLEFEHVQLNGQYLFEKTHLEKIIMNLLSNAIKFTGAGGKVNVTLSGVHLFETQEQIIIKVRDNGQGIPKDKLGKLFDRFYQVDDSDTRRQEGTGIGLSLVKELTELMNGEIFVESDVGLGTTFTLKLPVDKVSIVENEEASEETLIPHQFDEEEALVLVVEDNSELRKFIVESLSEKRNVLSAKNGSEAWEIIQKELPDIVVSDVMMPVMNGYELCQKVKNDIRTSHISFVMLTAKTAQESKETGLSSGADEYLTKPFHAYELELRIDNLIRQQKNMRDHFRSNLLSNTSSLNVQNVEDAFIHNLYTYLEDYHNDSALDVPQIAEAMSMSKSTLNRKLKSILNISALGLLKKYRLKKAVALLKAGEQVSQVAYLVGFDSPSYFTQLFKETYGQTPTEYKNDL